MRTSLSLAMIAACAALLVTPYSVSAADLAAHSRIGAIFAEPAERVVLPPVYARADNLFVAENIYAFQQRIPGYYGRPGDFRYRTYYGTPALTIFGGDPYACTILGWC